MKHSKLSAAAALTAGSALVLSACAPAGPADAKKEEGGGSVSYSVGADEFASYNGVQSNTYSTYNSAVVDRLFSSFWTFGPKGEIVRNEEFGTYKKVSDDPLTVEYEISEDAKWSDGTDVTAGDFIVQWAADNPEITKEDGETPLFDSITSDPGTYIKQAPKGDPKGKKFTVTYDQPYADWEILINTALPAHVIAEESGMEFEELVEAAREKDADKLEKAAKFWNEGWDFKPGKLPDQSKIPSMGPYKIKEDGWQAGQSITLEANDKYWGEKPGIEELVIKMAAPETHVQSLQNGDIDVIEPQATVDTMKQLEGLGDQAKVQTGDLMTWEHLDFYRGEGSPFNDEKVREAFALCVPRQQIVDNLVKPIVDDAEVMNLREVFPFQDGYEDIVKEAVPEQMQSGEADVEKAKQLLKEAGAEGTTIRVGYQNGNQRRTETVSLIKSSCDEAGFEIKDAGDENFFTEVMPAGDFDVALFAWSGSGQKASGRNIYHSSGKQNQVKYSNEKVDKAWDELASELDEDKQKEKVAEIEKLLWEDYQAIPLYAHPGIVGHSANLENVEQAATQSGALWNVEKWTRSE